MSERYLDFDLQLKARGDDAYHVSVVRSPAGETPAPETIRFPFGERELERLQLKLENALLRSRTRTRLSLPPEEQAVQDFGRKLFDAVFMGEVRSLYYESLREADRSGKGLRLKLRLLPPEFAVLPWEFLHEPRTAAYVCLSRDYPLVRYLELARPVPPLAVQPPLRVLGMVASPSDLAPLDVHLEKQNVERALLELQKDGLVELQWLPGETVLDLQRALRRSRREPWHIFHFVGHGGFDPRRDEGVIYLANKQGRAAPLTATQLARVLGDHRPLRLAVLNACEGAKGSTLDIFSSTAATLVRRGLPAVLAMQYEISDHASVLLAEMFYESLADGLPVDSAVSEARKAISLDNVYSLEWGTPVLYMRAKDGRIFNISEQAPRPQRPVSKKPSPEAVSATTDSRKDRRTRPPVEVEKQRTDSAPSHPLSAPTAGIAIPHIVMGSSPLEMEWCWLPGGTFTMGSDEVEDEKPLHEVHVDGFWMARYPVTNAQYRLFLEVGGYQERHWWSDNGWRWRDKQGVAQPRYWTNSKWNGDKQPVVGVCWYEAEAFCRWTAEATSAPLRLPTEAEWEKAARGTDKRRYPWGSNDPTDKLCNFTGNVGKTTPVGQYSPGGDGPYGCADLAGNVWEWTASWYQAYPDNQKANDNYGEKYRVVRGGSWGIDAFNLRASYRLRLDPSYRNDLIGFRCASTPF